MCRDIARRLESYAQQGLRVLALAAAKPDPRADYKDENNFVKLESNMTFIGLACVLDPPRAQVYDSIAKCKNAGIRVIVITGDNKVHRLALP